MFEFLQPFMEEDNGTNIAGANAGEPADTQNNNTDNLDNTADTGANDDSGNADQNTQQSFKDNPQNKAFAEMRRRVDASENFAKSLGYNSFEELQYAQQQQNYVNQGYDPATAQIQARMDMLQAQVLEQNNRARISEEKSKLTNAKYFKDLEPDIDKMIAANPGLGVEACFKFLKGEKIDELVAKETAAAKQKTLNNINSKSHLKTEGDGANDGNDIEIDPDTLQMYQDMGMSKADAQKYHKKLYGKG